MIDNRKIVALCTSRFDDDVCHETITSLNQELNKIGYSLFVYVTPSDLYWGVPSETGEMSIFHLVDMSVIDVLIIFTEKIKSVSAIEELERRAKEHDVPVISIGNTGGKCYDVEFDYEYGFETVVRHVLEEHKPETLHFLAGFENNEFSDKRLNVFKQVIKEYNISFDDSMISYGEFWSAPAAAAIEKLIEENRLPDALVCANDVMAIAACNTLRKHGYNVPQDIIVTGFDGFIEIEFSVPKITSCKCQYSAIAAKCAEISAMLCEGKEPPRTNKILPQIILSESCGCDFSERVNISEYLNESNNIFYQLKDESRNLAEITAKMQICRTLREAAGTLNDPSIIYDLCCMLTPECVDESINPLDASLNNPFGEKMYLFFNADSPNDPPREFLTKEIIPDLEKQIAHGYPIIFIALHVLDIPLGYVCFHFHNYDIVNYVKISQKIIALNNAIGGFRNIRYQRYLAKQLENSYKIDPLTGLYNRRGFSQEYEKLLSELRENDCLTMVLSDLDGLKQINDHYGHGEGDQAIRTVAEALRQACPDDAICLRFGGDEMLAVIRGVADEATIRQAITAYLDDYNNHSGKPYKVSTSLGIYITENNKCLDIEYLIKKADILMYTDKNGKKKSP